MVGRISIRFQHGLSIEKECKRVLTSAGVKSSVNECKRVLESSANERKLYFSSICNRDINIVAIN